MTKKHFEALAAALNSVGPLNGDMTSKYAVQWLADCNQVANVCAQFSPRFDRARFLAACGVED